MALIDFLLEKYGLIDKKQEFMKFIAAEEKKMGKKWTEFTANEIEACIITFKILNAMKGEKTSSHSPKGEVSSYYGVKIFVSEKVNKDE